MKISKKRNVKKVNADSKKTDHKAAPVSTCSRREEKNVCCGPPVQVTHFPLVPFRLCSSLLLPFFEFASVENDDVDVVVGDNRRSNLPRDRYHHEPTTAHFAVATISTSCLLFLSKLTNRTTTTLFGINSQAKTKIWKFPSFNSPSQRTAAKDYHRLKTGFFFIWCTPSSSDIVPTHVCKLGHTWKPHDGHTSMRNSLKSLIKLKTSNMEQWGRSTTRPLFYCSFKWNNHVKKSTSRVNERMFEVDANENVCANISCRIEGTVFIEAYKN